MSEHEQPEVAIHAADSQTRPVVDEVTPELREWFRLAGFSRTEWQRLLYARWRYRRGELTEYPQGE